MNFKLDDDSVDKIYDIFEHIEEKLGIDLNNCMYERKGEVYLKTIVSDKTLFEKDSKTNIIPNEKTKCKCNAILQTQSVY